MLAVLAKTDYPFLDIVWTMFIFFAFVIWIWLLIMVLADNFARRDHSRLGEGGMDGVRDLPPVDRRAGVHDRQAARRRDGDDTHRLVIP